MTRDERRETLFRFEDVLTSIEQLERASVVKSYAETKIDRRSLVRITGKKSRFDRHPASALLYRIVPHDPTGITRYLVVPDEETADAVDKRVFPDTPPTILYVAPDAHAWSIHSAGYRFDYV